MKLTRTVLAVLSIWLPFAGVIEAKQPHLNRKAAIQIARNNLQTLKKPLPQGYRAVVKDGKAYVEAGPDREIYVVLFTVAQGRKRRVIYVVDIDKLSRKISSFTDYRNVMHLIP